MSNIHLPDDERQRIEDSAAGYHGVYNDENIRNITWISNQIVAHAQNHDEILELGLGDGTTTRIFQENFKQVTTLDGSSILIDKFKEDNPDLNSVDLVCTFFEEYNPGKTFQNIAMCNVLEHVYDPGFIIEHYKKWLAPGGRFFISVPSATSLNRRIGFEAGLLDDLFAFQEQDYILGHRRYYSSETIVEFLKDCGLTIHRVEGVALKVITTGQMQKLNFDDNIHQALLKIGVDYPELTTMVYIEASVNS
ncbi:class I SAM-dependent methyltransferase [bacterium SCSIO 12741]|nr:class I SAM-dependent methyltransferase [bacterium SCSIO 12741]